MLYLLFIDSKSNCVCMYECALTYLFLRINQSVCKIFANLLCSIYIEIPVWYAVIKDIFFFFLLIYHYK